MAILLQIGIVFCVCLAGEAISLFLPFPLPGSVISMALLFALLMTKVLKTEQIKQKAEFLSRNMGICFIPAGVGIISSFSDVEGFIMPLIAVVIITTMITFMAVSGSVWGVIKLQEAILKKEKGEKCE